MRMRRRGEGLTPLAAARPVRVRLMSFPEQ